MYMKRYHHVVHTLLFTSVWLFSGCGSDTQKSMTPAPPVNVVLARPEMQAGTSITASGQIVAADAATISTRMMGFITSVPVKAGDRVSKGALLLTIHNGDILARRAQAQAMVQEAEAAVQDAQKDFERYTTLYQQQSASAKELENMTLHYTAMKSKAEAARQMQREAEAMLTYTNLTAPFDGVVTQVYGEVGSMANPGAPLLVVERQGMYDVQTSVSEADVARLQVGARTTITLKATGATIAGKVADISPSASHSGGRYRVTVSLSAPAAQPIYAGMSVHVSMEAAGHAASAALRVPASALVHHDQLTGLYTISAHHTAVLRWIRVGRTVGEQVEVLSGLRGDEAFIVSAAGRLYNGAPVQE